MTPYLFVIDDFLSAPLELRKWAIEKGFRDEISPVDGLSYKGVCKDIPWVFDQEVTARLSYCLQALIEPKLSFVRLSTENLAKRWIHCDPMYSVQACIIYLNESYPYGAGTALFEHPEITLNKLTPAAIETWDKDANDPDAWDNIGRIPMRFNRAAVYTTETFHAPEPMNGFGKTAEDGRMIYCMFFNSHIHMR